MQHKFRPLDTWPPLAVLVLSAVLIAAIAWFDSFLGPWVHTGVLYVGPVALTAWHCGRLHAVMLAIAAVFIWLATDSWWTNQYYHPYVHLWNSFVRLFLLLLTAYFMSSFRSQFILLQNYAEHDPLTGLCNRRSFIKNLSYEYNRLARFHHPLSIAYFDLDNFKSVNDTHGHAEGDRLLCMVAEVLARRGRNTDVPARLGGDEFATLLVETNQEAAIAAIQGLSRELRHSMLREGWPVTFSIGVVTFCSPADSVDEMLHCADQLMYLVKHNHKDGILHQRWDQGALTPPMVINEAEGSVNPQSLGT